MKVYRIEREKYLKSTLSGIGASLSDRFRWNSRNTRLAYTAESRALAILEILVRLDLCEYLPTDRYYVEIEIPDDVVIKQLKPENLPEDWDAKPPITATQKIGDDFVHSNKAAILKVPSSIVPFEYNHLINPAHADSKRLKVVDIKPIKFDQRLI